MSTVTIHYILVLLSTSLCKFNSLQFRTISDPVPCKRGLTRSKTSTRHEIFLRSKVYMHVFYDARAAIIDSLKLLNHHINIYNMVMLM